MAAGSFVIIDRAVLRLGAEVNLASDALQIVLTTNAQALSASFAGASGNALYADLTAEVVGTGYDAGGETLANVSWTRSAGVALLAADPTTWLNATFTAKYAVVLDTAVSGSPIIGFADLETTDPAGRAAAGTDFTVSWPNGIFDAARA